MQRRIMCLLAVGLAGTGLSAQSETGMFKFSGFGTLAVTQSSEKKADFITNYSQPNGAGFSRNLDFGGDSSLGGQIDATFNETFSAVVQAISERRYDATFTPYLNMAHLKINLTPSLSVQVGRMPFSAFLISQYQKVGYATPWVRPPVEVYQFNPLNAVDGVGLTWRVPVGEVALTGQAVGGSSSARLAPKSENAEFKGDDIVSASVSAAYGNATFRVFHLQMKGTINSDRIDGPAGPFAILRSPTMYYPPLGVMVPNPYYNLTLADQFQIKKDKLIYQSVGFNYDPGGWFLMIEETRESGDENMFLHFTAGYATLGVRFGDWTPYATAGWKHTTSPTTNANPVINAVISTMNTAQSSYSGGVRWDFHKNLALKVQHDIVKNANGSSGALTAIQPGFNTGESYNLSTVALNFVF